MMAKSLDALLAEQVTYYRAVAGEYEDHSIQLPGGSVTAVDASPEMLAIAEQRAGEATFAGGFYWGEGGRA